MTDIVERLRATGIDYTVEWGSGELYDEAADEIERLRLDAARYRWLRDNPDSGLIALKLHVYPKEFYAGPALDAAIDAAMKG